MILKSKKANKIPGDETRELLSPATDAAGKVWPKGTQYRPLSGGHDNLNDDDYATVMLDGRRTFYESAQD